MEQKQSKAAIIARVLRGGTNIVLMLYRVGAIGESGNEEC
jgi:hypothetical protein